MKIKFFLYVNNYNGGPQIRIWNTDNLLIEKTLSKKGPQSIELETDLDPPAALIVEHYGKDMKYDTKIANDEIIDDKGFVIEKIQIGKFTLHNEIHELEFITESGVRITKNNYIGYNGKLIIDIDAKDLLTWYYKLKKKLLKETKFFNYKQFKEEIFEGKESDISY
jgi:hypothetical protein